MSHDQRPGKMRVVQDATRAPGARTGDLKATGGIAQRGAANAVNGAAATGANAIGTAADARSSAPGSKTLPMLQAGIFLLACLIGGVAVAIIRPF